MKTALRIDPDYAPAHQGLGAVLADLATASVRRIIFRKVFATMPFQACRIAAPGRRWTLLQLVSSGGGNIPTASFLTTASF